MASASADLTMKLPCIILRAGIVVCLGVAAVILAADVSEYPSLNRAGLRVLATGSLPLLCLGALNLVVLGSATEAPWHRVSRWLAVAANVLLLASALRLLRAGAPPMGWMLTGAGVCLVVGSVACRRQPAGGSRR